MLESYPKKVLKFIRLQDRTADSLGRLRQEPVVEDMIRSLQEINLIWLTHKVKEINGELQFRMYELSAAYHTTFIKAHILEVNRDT